MHDQCRASLLMSTTTDMERLMQHTVTVNSNDPIGPDTSLVKQCQFFPFFAVGSNDIRNSEGGREARSKLVEVHLSHRYR